MHWQDIAFIIGYNNYQEKSIIVQLLTLEHGLTSGIVFKQKDIKNIIQIGNIAKISWQARLENHLGLIKAELLKSNLALFMNDYLALQAINVISDLLRHSLAENHPEPKIYNKLVELIDKFYTKKNWAIDYINFELLLLQELGYGLDLRNCAVTGETENLTHISPKTGRSVSEPVAQNYLDRLLALPKFLINPCFNYNTDDLIAGFKITSYFLEKKMLNLSKKLPLSRKIFIDKILNTN